MRLCQLAYRLKGTSRVETRLFESFQDALEYMITSDIQHVVGNMDHLDAKAKAFFLEGAGQKCKADWHEFSHVEVA